MARTLGSWKEAGTSALHLQGKWGFHPQENGVSVLQPHGTESVGNPSEPPADSSSGPADKSQEGRRHLGWVMLWLVRPRAENPSEPHCAWASDPQRLWDNHGCVVLSRWELVMATTQTNTVLGAFHGVGLPQSALSLFSFVPSASAVGPFAPPKGICSPHSPELLLFDYECVQSHTQPNYCFWLTPTHNVVCHGVLLLISQMNTFLFF